MAADSRSPYAILLVEDEQWVRKGLRRKIDELGLGFEVHEVPIVFVDRQIGSSKMDSKIFLEAVRTVWKLRLSALRGEQR